MSRLGGFSFRAQPPSHLRYSLRIIYMKNAVLSLSDKKIYTIPAWFPAA